jgi:hypothetical protein
VQICCSNVSSRNYINASFLYPISIPKQRDRTHHCSKRRTNHLKPTMPPIPPLFVLPIPPALTAGSSAQAGQGSFICTQAAPQVYLLSFSSPPDNRLVPAFNQTFLLALDIIEARLPRGVVITTSSITKFYSNGLDFENAIKDPTFFPTSLYPLWRRLITVCSLPEKPTIKASQPGKILIRP